jgi:UDP-GlcNAc:undecaprenyl-phosphate GlcNAc-1-phosphate transferase
MDISIPTLLLQKLLRFNDITVSAQYDKYLNYWPLLVIGIVSAFILSPILGRIANKYKITYIPKTKRNNREFDNEQKALHKIETPALGGLAMSIPVLIMIPILFRLDPITIPIFISLLVLVIGSLLDDVLNLPAKVQFGYQALAAGIIAISIIDLSNVSFFADDLLNLSTYTWSGNIFNLALSFVFPGDIFLMLWIMFCINAVKWVGGSPGLVESYSLVIFMLLFVVSVRTFSIFSSSMSILIAGTLISVLYFAYPNPKIMSGSTGKTLFGFLISVLSLISGAKISTTIMLMAIPLIDAVYVILHRYIKYRPKNLLDILKFNDATHLHHQLLKLNLTDRQVLLLEASVSLLVSSLAILTTGAFRYFALIFGLAFVVALIVFVNYKASKKDIPEEKKSPESKYSY